MLRFKFLGLLSFVIFFLIGCSSIKSSIINKNTSQPLGTPQTPVPSPSPWVYPPPIATNTSTPILITLSTPLTDQEVSAKIAACYHPTSGCSACSSKLNNSVQYVQETTRAFINLPMDLYPKYILTKEFITTINGTASIGWISNGGLPGEALDATSGCWSTYVEFDGSGEVDLQVKSLVSGVPDYFVRFIVGLP